MYYKGTSVPMRLSVVAVAFRIAIHTLSSCLVYTANIKSGMNKEKFSSKKSKGVFESTDQRRRKYRNSSAQAASGCNMSYIQTDRCFSYLAGR